MDKREQIQNEFVEKGVEFYKKENIGYYNVAMRFGKTLLTIKLLQRLFNYNCSVLITYPDNKLINSWQTELATWKYENPNIVFVNFSSLDKYIQSQFDVLVVDEFHDASDNERAKCLDISNNCKKTILLSGTVTEEVVDLWERPKCIAEYSTLEGINDGILADYNITVHLVNLDNKRLIKQKNGKQKTEKQQYDAYTWVIEKMKKENKNFMHLALARNRLSLNSIAKTEFVRKLLKRMEDKRVLVFTGLSKAADSIGIKSYHTKSKDDSSYTSFQNKVINHLALAAIGKVGVTYTDLDCVILTNFSYNEKETAQILNRALKLDYHGKIADLRIIAINEKPELKKLKETLSLLDKNKIKYV